MLKIITIPLKKSKPLVTPVIIALKKRGRNVVICDSVNTRLHEKKKFYKY